VLCSKGNWKKCNGFNLLKGLQDKAKMMSKTLPFGQTSFSKNGSNRPKPGMKRQFASRCPTTGQAVVSADWKYFGAFGEPITWWLCPACHGWHVLVE